MRIVRICTPLVELGTRLLLGQDPSLEGHLGEVLTSWFISVGWFPVEDTSWKAPNYGSIVCWNLDVYVSF